MLMLTSSTMSYSCRRGGCGRSCCTGQCSRYNPCNPGEESLHPGVDPGRVGGTPTAIAGDTKEHVAVALLQGQGSPAVPLAGVRAGRVGAQPPGWWGAREAGKYDMA